MDVKKELDEFLNEDRESVNALNDSVSWHGYSTEKQVSFLTWRIVHTSEFVVFLANYLAAQQSVQRTGGTRRKIRYHSSHGGGKHTRR